jgi:hypothetical protein
MFALICASLLICALAVSVAPRLTRQSAKNNFVTIFILSPVVLSGRSEAYVRDAPMVSLRATRIQNQDRDILAQIRKDLFAHRELDSPLLKGAIFNGKQT